MEKNNYIKKNRAISGEQGDRGNLESNEAESFKKGKVL